MNILRRIFCCQRYYSSGVYRLQLEKDKIYVGKSKNIVRRIWCHVNDNGSVWTKTYEDVEKLNEVLPVLIENYPHVVISRQVLQKSHVEYLKDLNTKEARK